LRGDCWTPCWECKKWRVEGFLWDEGIKGL
jgi:hypothetical protein